MMAVYIFGGISAMALLCSILAKEDRAEFLVVAAGALLFGLFLVWVK